MDFTKLSKEELVNLLERIRSMLHGEDAGDICMSIADLLKEDLRS